VQARASPAFTSPARDRCLREGSCGQRRMSHRWQPRYSAPRGARVCLGLSGTGGARHVVSLRASELSSGSQGPPILPLPHEKCHEPPACHDFVLLFSTTSHRVCPRTCSHESASAGAVASARAGRSAGVQGRCAAACWHGCVNVTESLRRRGAVPESCALSLKSARGPLARITLQAKGAKTRCICLCPPDKYHCACICSSKQCPRDHPRAEKVRNTVGGR
jgi:hypothetical protein